MFLINILGMIMRLCYNAFGNYGLAIIIFTFISKIILLPISIWVQKNSIKMVKMQPDINKIKINYYGDRDKIAEEQEKLYKKEKYNAFASLIPLIIQILLLMGLVEVINHPLTHIVKLSNDTSIKLIEVALENNSELEAESSSLELSVVNDIKKENYIEQYKSVLENSEYIENIKNINLDFIGFDMSWVAANKKRNSLFNSYNSRIKCSYYVYRTEYNECFAGGAI